MKSIAISTLALTAVASVAFAGANDSKFEGKYVLPYAEIGTTLEGGAYQNNVDVTVGVKGRVMGNTTYGEFSTNVGESTLDYTLSLGASHDFANDKLNLGVSANYNWGDETGTDAVGFGENNEWGQFSLTPKLTYSPGFVGGEYAYISHDIALNNIADYQSDATKLGLGYTQSIGNAYVTGEVSWGVNTDLEFVNEANVGVTLGYNF